MRIALDAAALHDDPAQRFGTATFSQQLINALSQFGKHTYRAYTFHTQQVAPPMRTVHLPKRAYMRIATSAYELVSPSQIYLAFNQAFPLTRARVFGFSHGAAALLYPAYYSTAEVNRQKSQLDRMFAHSERVFTTSDDVREQLLSLGYTTRPIHALPIGLPYNMRHQSANKKPIILTVAMDHPIKRIDRLVSLFVHMRRKFPMQMGDYTLQLVGPHAKHHDPQQNIICTGYASPSQLAKLYQSAKIYVCMSQYESLHFPFLEALCANCVAIGIKRNVISELKAYVHEAQNESELEQYILKACSSNKPYITPKSFAAQFNWEKTVRGLESWY
jgi:glycosyltransferase involved in cell wall biosynthesis